MKISLCMIVKNEEKYIEQCLENALPVVDEAVVVDTGSEDATSRIIKDRFKDKVNLYTFTWNNDFSSARNESLKYANGDWILVLDADEKLVCDKEKLIHLLNNTDGLAFKIVIFNLLSNGRVERAAGMIRLFRNKGAKYSGALHEQLHFEADPLQSPVIDENICQIIHYGYLQSSYAEKDKIRRNISILRSEIKKCPDYAFNWYNLGIMNMIAGKYEDALDNFTHANKLRKGKKYGFEINLALRMAQCLYAIKSFKICKSFLEKSLQDSTIASIPDFFYYLGIANKELGLTEEAVSCFIQCISIGETDMDVSNRGMGSFIPRLELGRIFVEKGNIDKAIMEYIEAIFSPYNYRKEGAAELTPILKQYNKIEILQELEKLTGIKNQ